MTAVRVVAPPGSDSGRFNAHAACGQAGVLSVRQVSLEALLLFVDLMLDSNNGRFGSQLEAHRL